MAVKAKLILILKADDTVVAEIDDPTLWQRVLSAVNQRGTGGPLSGDSETNLGPPHGSAQDRAGGLGDDISGTLSEAGDAVAKFAQQVGVSTDQIAGACSPSSSSPFLHLDVHCWEEMKSHTPRRGPGAVSPIALTATLLALWFRAAGLGNPTQAQAHAILRGIGIEDHNATRGIQSAEWLQARPGGVIVLNPATISRALNLARSFCTKQWSASRGVNQ